MSRGVPPRSIMIPNPIQLLLCGLATFLFAGCIMPQPYTPKKLGYKPSILSLSPANGLMDLVSFYQLTCNA
jgi:hypothetical protein